ncbi:T9SS sorting signal type C domain-containing protein [Flavobacterium sp. WC2416]|uniref:T9SS sorting signal type C domain-containing protein n=1 Tax=Flavobacterium sp. WC2416 TaxID=3234141 RepID=A0AB39WEB8_9FLAO
MNRILLLINKKIIFCIICLIISNVSFSQTTLFQYDFEGSYNPNINNTVGTPSIAQNGVSNALISNSNPCSGSRSLAGSNWNTGDYYLFTVNTTGYENMIFSYCNSISNNGIGSFLVLVSSDKGATTSTIITSYTPTTSNVTKTSITLPASANNNSEVWIAIYKDSNSNNTNRVLYIDDVTLKGCPISAGTLSGTQYLCTYGTTTSTFSSTVSGGTWSSSNTGIATVNASSGLVTGKSAGTAVITYTIGGSGGCTTYTATRTVYVSNGPGAGPNSLSGSNSQCQNSTTTYTITPDVYSSSYVWLYSGSGATITPAADGLSASVTFSATATAGNINVQSVNGCGNGGGGKYLYVSIASSSAGGTLPSNVSGCANTYIANIALSGQVGTPIRWESSTDNFATAPTTIVTTSNNINISGLTQTTYYRAVVQNSPCSGISYSSVCTATISNNTASTASSSPTVCSGTSMTNITHTTTGATGISNNNVIGANGLPAGVKAVWASNTITISGTPTDAAGTYSYSIQLTGGCGNVSAVGSITLSTSSAVPTTITAPTTICVGSSTSLTVSGGTLGGGASAKWYSGSCGVTLVGSGNTISVSPTITTTYYVRYEGSCNSTSCISTTVTVNPSLSNNSLSFSSGTSGQVSATAAEGGNALLTAPLGTYFSNVAFASYGTPGGTSPNFTIGSCHATSSQSVTEGYLLGNNSATIPATNGVFGDPCVGTVKKVYILASYIEPICNGSKATLTGSIPSGGTGTYAYLWESSTTSATTGFSAATGTNNTINYTTGSITQTTWFRRTVTSCTLSSTSAVVMIKVNGTNSWNGTVWSSGIAPTLSDKIIFAGDYSVDADVNGCSCTVSGSKNVVIKTGRTMKIVNEVTVLGSGKLTFENSASLVQVNDASVNSGKITYMRETTPISNFDYTYWSSPVIDQKLIDLSPNTLGDKFMSFDSGIDNWRYEDAYNNMMGTGVGYIIRGPQSYAAPAPPSTYLASFIGVPNNGALSTSIGVAGNSNLIGNPYPSALDANSFLIANNTLLDGTIYFWTHNTDIGKNVSNPGSGVYAYSSDDYATYNLSGGVATQAPSSTNPGAVNSNAPTGKIASGQAFFGTSIKAGNAVFNNNMRVGVGTLTGNNSQFFKFENTKKSTVAVEANRVWLDLTNKQGAFKETLIAYIIGATNDYESAYDGESFDGNAFIDFYSLNSDKNLTIQGRALPFDNSEAIPLGYTTIIAGDFSINIRDKDGFFTTQKVFLEDKLLDTVFDLTQGTYNFTTEEGVFNDRFVLSYTNKTLATDDFENLKYGVVISNKNKEIQIKSSDDLIDKIFVYDFSGKQLYKKIKVDNIEYTIPNLGPTDQALIVKVVLQNGQTVNKKIVY